MRSVAIVAGGIVAALLGLVQVASMAVYGDLAQPPAVPALLPASLGLRLAALLGSRSSPLVLRIAYAQALVHRGERADAAAVVATIPDTRAAADLRGQLAEAIGDSSTALAAYVRAADDERAQRLIDTQVDAGRFAVAAALERQLVAALDGPGQAAVRARAFWRLGQIEQVQSGTDAAYAADLQRASLAAYEAALMLAPNEETYLLAAGREALTLGDRAAARRYYERALEAVPNSTDARAGLLEAQR